MQPRIKTIEQLEPRQLLANSDFLAVPLESDRPEDAEDESVCEEADNYESFPYHVPAAISVDFNVDGRFDSKDLVAMFQHSDHTKRLGPDKVDSVFTEFDLVVAQQLAPYESPEVHDPNSSCFTERLVTDNSGAQVSQYDYRSAGDQQIREAVTYVARDDQLSFRSAQHYSRQGILRSSTFDTHRGNFESIYSRSRSEFDRDGKLGYHTTLLFNRHGGIRRTTETAFFGNHGPVSSSTDVRYYGASGETFSRMVHYYDSEHNQIGTERYEFADGAPTKLSTAVVDSGGNLVQEFETETPTKGFNPTVEIAADTYLTRVKDAHHTAWHVLKPIYFEISKMNFIPAQTMLESLIDDADLADDVADRYRNLNLYFEFMTEMAQAMQTYKFEDLLADYSQVIEPSTGQWQGWFRRFADAENLQLPLTPLLIAHDPIDANRMGDLAASYRNDLGLNPTQHFQTYTEDPKAHLDKSLESMRKVKSQIRLLELDVQNDFSVFDWIVLQDRSEVEAISLQAIRPLTSWHFFELRDGQYDTGDVSEDVIRDRVLETMTDENAFYVINIEYWHNDGSLASIAENMNKLKRAADLVHKYNPNLMVGFYRMLPKRAPNAAYAGEGSLAYQQWQERNDKIAQILEDSVDLIFPSLYVLHLGQGQRSTQELWTTFAEETMAEARRVADGKPVIPFLGLSYHRNGLNSDNDPNNLKADQWLEPDFLLYQLAKLEELADGTVIYNSIRGDQSSIAEARVLDAIRLFEDAKKAGRLGELRHELHELLYRFHNEIVERLNLEKRIAELSRQSHRANASGDLRLADTLDSEVVGLRRQLQTMIDLWQFFIDF